MGRHKKFGGLFWEMGSKMNGMFGIFQNGYLMGIKVFFIMKFFI